jgi:hypothetical protein
MRPGGALVLHIGDASITETGVVTQSHGTGDLRYSPAVPPVTRALVVDDTLWTVSGAGLQASNGDTLADMGWIPYP